MSTLPLDILKEMHPDALCIVPMGRAAMVVELPPEVDNTSDAFYDAENAVRGKEHFPGYDDAIIIMYHDPGWMGEERTAANLRRYSARLHVQGNRSGVDMYYEDAGGVGGAIWAIGIPHWETCVVCRGTGEGNWRIPQMRRSKDDPWAGIPVEELPEEAFEYRCLRCWGSGKVVWRLDWDHEGDNAEGIRKSKLTWQELHEEEDREYKEAFESAKDKITTVKDS